MSSYWKKKMEELEEEEKKAPSMSYWEKKTKELEDEKKTVVKVGSGKKDNDDIAPIKSTKDDGKLDFFQKGAYEGFDITDRFDNGYQIVDIAKTYHDIKTRNDKALLGTVADAGLGVVKGIAGVGEGIGDLISYGIAGAADALGKDQAADRWRKGAKENVIDNLLNPVDDYLDKYSILGKTSEAVMQGIGQVATVIATGSIAGAAGAGAAGTTAVTTGLMGLSGTGSGMSEAYQMGANDLQALKIGLNSGAADAVSELIFGGLGKTVNALGFSRGLSSLDDILAKAASGKVKNQIAKNVIEFGIKSGAEGLEEVISGIAQAYGKYDNLLKDQGMTFGDVLKDENLLEQFVVGTLTSGLAQGPSLHTANKTGTDFITGLNQNEQAVVKKEIENRIAEAEADGTKLTAKEKAAIEEQVEKDLEKGYISTDLIDEVVGGETYRAYKDSVDSEDALFKEYEELGKATNPTLAQQYRYGELDSRVKSIKDNDLRSRRKEHLDQFVSEQVKGSRLAESYNERVRRGQKFEADLSKYDKKYHSTIQRAIDSGFMNNTNRTHDFVDWVARVSADIGTNFDFTSNEKLKESGFAMDDGVVQNGFKTKDGITINLSSSASRRFVVGHEVTHVLEGTDLYKELQKTVFDYAKKKGEYDTRLESITALYKKYAPDADPMQELTADLVGEYIFSDQDFVNNLSVKNQNVFQKVYSEIKHMVKLATAGSEEARMLEKAKRAFEKAYREASKAQRDTSKQTEVKNSISETTDGRNVAVVDNDILSHIDTSKWDNETKTEAKKAANEALKVFSDGFNINGVEYIGNKKSRDEYTRSRYSEALANKNPEAYLDKMRAASVLDDVVRVATDWTNDGYLKHERADYVDFIRGKTLIKSGDRTYSAVVLAGMTEDGRAVFYDVEDIYPESFEIKESELSTAVATNKSPNAILESSDSGMLAQKGENVKDSLSDSDGRLVIDGDEVVKALSGGSATKYSLSTWTPETQARVSEDLVKAGHNKEDVDKWIKDTNSIAAVIASDKARLDFEAADNQVMLKDNQEYIKTLDASTLCAKRLAYQGTFNAIQHRMPNTVLTSDMLIDLLNIMKSHKVQTPCGVCYVESRRRHLGKYAQDWLDSYDGEYKPRLDEITTSDGLEALRQSHPQAYTDFVKAMDKKGSSNPKVVQLRTEYRNEIMSLTPAQIRKIEAIGGLRVQSFSDFETPHLLDMMQAVMDMSAKQLHSQAYTKVPNFAWVFGDTGIKINLSLIADGDGFDSDGNLAFSSTEGMDINEAMKLRDAYSQNVGTIIVGANDKHILACMADDRIDYIIPFHRSGWGMRELELMGMDSYTDYTYGQKEHDLTKPTKVIKGVQQYAGLENLYPPDYWNYELSGKENAERYLNLCAKLGREPKFAQFLVNNGDGSYSLQPDGSTDGYWKTLIDFKMYDNDGNGAAQQVVTPNFNMTEAHRVLNEYEGGANSLPVSNKVVEEFVAKYSDDIAPVQYSLSDSNGNQLSTEQQDYFKDSVVRDENGNLKVMYHGTSKGGFNVFDTYGSNYGLFGTGSYFTDSKTIGESYTKKGKGKNPQVYEAYLNIKNPMDMDAAADPAEWAKAFPDADFPESGTNEQFYRAVEEFYADQWMSKWEVAEEIQSGIESSMGYDGITHIGGGRVNPDGERHQVYIAFQPEQIKNIDNQKPTENPDIRYSLTPVEAVEPSGNQWARTHTTEEAVSIFPNMWNVAAEESEVRNPTQITSTVNSYRKIYNFLQSEGFNGTILDASSGLGYGTRAGIEEYGFDVEDIEPYPDKGYNPKYKDYSNLNKKYDAIISNAVLNVLPQDQRDALVVKMGELLNDGGRMFINVRGKDVESLAKTGKNIHLGNMEWIETVKGSYQKGFTKDELKAYLEDALGDGFMVEKTNMFGAVSVVVTKNIRHSLTERNDIAPDPLRDLLYEDPAPEDIEPIAEESSVVEVFPDDLAPVGVENTPTVSKMETTTEVDARKKAAIEKRLAKEKAALAEEYRQKRAEVQKDVNNKNAYISRSASELYQELRGLRKGVKASDRLGFLLDHGYEWSAIRAALVNIQHTPDKQVNQSSAIENIARQMLNDDYEDRVYELDRLEIEYQQKLEEAEKKAEAERNNPRATRKELHARIIDNIKSKFAEKGIDLDSVLKKAKNLSTFATVDNIPQRVMEKALGYKEGGILSDITVNKVAQNETEGIKWLNSFTDRKKGLLAQISKQYNIKPRSKESAAAQMYAEGFYVGKNNEIIRYGDRELAIDFPDPVKQAQIKGLARDKRIRQIYDDTLKAINESRTRNAYPEIGRLDNYFLHFRAMNDTFSRLGLPFNPNDIRAKDLPTDLNGVTADLKPGQPFFASSMHREGKRTDFDLLGGLEQYLTSAKNQIYHIDDIQTLRALRNYIADTYGQANGLEGLDAMSEEEQQDRIEQVYGSHLSTFAKFLNEEANVLAGKTALIDRGLEGIIGRRGMTFLDTVNRQVGANMVGYNVSSSLTNLLAPVQAFAKSNKAAFIKGMAQFASNKVNSIYGKGDGFAEQSPVMIRRKGAERFHRTLWQKMSDPGYALMSAVDEVSTELIARAKYNEFVGKGMDSQQAHIETDKWVSRLMGDRSLGQQPQLYNSKMLGIVTKFQLEVRNQLDSQFYDTIQEAKVSNEDIQNGLLKNAKTAAKVTSTFFQLAVAQHLFGKAFESVAGYNPAFDIISAIIKAFGWDDEEESEDTVLDNLEQGFFELMGDMPYVSTLTGGRIPIASALPIEELYKGEDQYGNEKSRWETLGEAAPYYLMPGGYGQVKKTVAGLDMFSDEHPIAGSYTDSGNLRFPVEDNLGSRAQAAIFGQYASQNARDYFDNERSALKPKQIQEFIDVGMSIQDYWKYRDGLSGLSKLEEKINYINGLNLTTAQKNVLVNNLTDRKEAIDMADYDEYSSLEEFDYANKNPEKYAFFEEIGITYETYRNADDDAKDAYDWAFNNPEKYTVSKAISDDYLTYYQYKKDLSGFDAKDENGETVSGLKKERVLNYINGLDMDYGQRIILYRSMYNSQADRDAYNQDIVDYLNSREDISYEEMITILKELDFTIGEDGTTIYWD